MSMPARIPRMVLLAIAWWLIALPLGKQAQADPFSGLSGEPGPRRTTLIDGQPLVNRRQSAKEKPEGFFSWLDRQRRRLMDSTRNFFSPRKPSARSMRPGRMKFPYQGNRPATKKKRSAGFWSRWWPFGRQRK